MNIISAYLCNGSLIDDHNPNVIFRLMGDVPAIPCVYCHVSFETITHTVNQLSLRAEVFCYNPNLHLLLQFSVHQYVIIMNYLRMPYMEKHAVLNSKTVEIIICSLYIFLTTEN